MSSTIEIFAKYVFEVVYKVNGKQPQNFEDIYNPSFSQSINDIPQIEGNHHFKNDDELCVIQLAGNTNL